MIINRGNSQAVDPLAWSPAVEAMHKLRTAERLNSMESLVCRVLAPFDRAEAKGRTEDQLAAIVAAWAGPLAKWIQIDPSRGAKARTLRLQAANPALIQTLRPRVPELVAALKPTGITEVRL
jgi:hypothetical protein